MHASGYFLIALVFVVGYVAIIFEYWLKVNKTAIAMLIAALSWALFFFTSDQPIAVDLSILAGHIAEVSQILFFLLGTMTLVELIDSHRGFQLITDRFSVQSKRKMMLLVALITFFLSAILDNLTTAILMGTLVRKWIPDPKERFFPICLIIVAANAGGAWTPIGDVTTTLLWIHGQLSSWKVVQALFLPSLASLIVPLLFFSLQVRGNLVLAKKERKIEPGAPIVFFVGLLLLIAVPFVHALTQLPPFMGVLFALSILWLITDFMHRKHAERKHLRVPHVLTRIDSATLLFFLGILLAVDALQTVGVMGHLANYLSQTIQRPSLIATLIGLVSAVVDNVPLVAATIGMYPLDHFPLDSPFWHQIAYAAGTGGSIFIIGSSAGVALMGIEKIHFFAYLKRATIPILLGYFLGFAIYFLQNVKGIF